MQRSQKIRVAENTFLVLLFITAICLPAVGLVFRWDVMPEQLENRRLTQPPVIPTNPEAISRFPENFTAYFNDNFGFRTTLIRWQALTRLRLLGSTSPLVIVGKDGWFFLASEYSAQGQRLVPPLTEQELNRWKRLLEARRDWLARRGIRYLFVVLPSKENIYPEYLPNSFKRHDQSRLDQLLNYLARNSDLKVLNLKTALYEAKTRQELFYRTDAHWNFYGGLVGYRAIVTELSKSFPRLQPVAESDCDLVVRPRVGNLINLIGLGDSVVEKSFDLTLRQPAFTMLRDEPVSVVEKPTSVAVAERSGSDLPRLVMFHDSANRFMSRFFPQNFSRTVFVFHPRLDPVLIESEHPDIVVQEMSELVLTNASSVDLSEIDLLEAAGKGKAAYKFIANYADATP